MAGRSSKIHLNENDLVSLKKPDLAFRTVILPVARAGPILKRSHSLNKMNNPDNRYVSINTPKGGSTV